MPTLIVSHIEVFEGTDHSQGHTSHDGLWQTIIHGKVDGSDENERLVVVTQNPHLAMTFLPALTGSRYEELKISFSSDGSGAKVIGQVRYKYPDPQPGDPP